MAKACNQTTVGLISKKETLHVQHTFFIHFFAVVLHHYDVKLPETSYTFYGGNVVRVLVHFFPLPLIFTLHYWWPLASHFVTGATIFFKNLRRPFSRLASLACRPLSLFLCLSLALYSKFVDMANYLGHVNTLDNTDREKISAFRFRLY